MDDVIKLLAALGPLIGGIGSTIGVVVVAFRKSNKERGEAAERGAHLSSVDAAQTELLQQLLDRVEKLEPSDQKSEDIQKIIDLSKHRESGGGE